MSMESTDPLRMQLQFLKGMSKKRLEQLHRLGLWRVYDLLFFFPRDYQDMTDRRDVDQLEEGKIQTVLGTIDTWETKSTRRGKMVILGVNCTGGYLQAKWFNPPFFLLREFAQGRRLLLTGKPKADHPCWAMNHPQLTYLSDNEETSTLEPFWPIYSLTEGLKQYALRRLLREQIPLCAPLLEEVFPEPFLKAHKLLPIAEAVRQIHFPDDITSLAWAKRRFVYQELFILQLALAVRRLQHRTRLKATPFTLEPKVDSRIRQRFPFTLTSAQEKVIREITDDMARPIPMNRLLQGDVGSGKTVVAVYAMLLAVASGHQAVFMAPTEVLARQHLRTLERMLQGSQVRIAPLFGGQKPAERATILQQISTGDAQLIVGTQAIIRNEIPFHRLGLVVIDEQHKFGVLQRAALKTGSRFDPHYLIMTATPIPRSVTMTLFGDLDVSIMDALPPGRQKVKTYVAPPDQREQWWKFVVQKVTEEGWQGYVVVPLVEESENFDVKSLEETYRTLSTGPLSGLRIGIIHGRMSVEEKERVMYDFRTGETQVLIATTVIEVGVDVPNANLMTIESAERFGLSQLHQLRGRIGRGKNPGFCTVFADSTTDDAQKRLKAFAATSSGFTLAEKDFEIRGAGDLFGTQQHGMPPLMVANLNRDRDVLEEAREDASKMVQEDPGLARPEHAKLRAQMLRRYGAVLELGDVG